MADLPSSTPIARLRALYRQGAEPFWALASQVVTSGGNFLTTVILVRTTGLAEFGRFSIAFLILMITRNYLEGLVLVPMSSIAPKLRDTSAKAYRGFLLMNGIAFAGATSLVLFAFAGVIGAAFGIPWLPGVATALAVANLGANLADFFRRYQFVIERGPSAFLVDLVRYAAQLALIAVLAVRNGPEFDAQTALYAMAAGGFIASALGYLLYGVVTLRQSVSRALWPRHWAFIKTMTLNTSIQTANANIPIAVSAAFLPAHSFGLVRAIQQLAQILNLPANAATQIMASMTSRFAGQNKLPQLIRMSLLAFGANAVLTFLLIVVIVGFPGIIPSILKVASNDRIPLLFAIFCLFYLAQLLRVILGGILMGLEMLTAIRRNVFLSLGVTAATTVALLPWIDELSFGLILLATSAASIVYQWRVLAKHWAA